MDRNNSPDSQKHINSVALRKESVDRNRCLSRSASTKLVVALRKESVDRNHCCLVAFIKGIVKSLSARRAWIEIAKI